MEPRHKIEMPEIRRSGLDRAADKMWSKCFYNFALAVTV
jgi:hypothetical protein